MPIFDKPKAIRILWACAAIAVCGCAPIHGDISRGSFQADRAFEDLERQVRFGPRIPGSPGHAKTIEWLQGRLVEAGWQVERQSFEHEGVALTNLIATHADDAVGTPLILGAHFDTRPIAERDPIDPEQPVPGANDGASGVAVLLELARVLDLDRIDVPVWLVFFDAEDSGGLEGWDWALGSRFFLESLAFPVQAAVIIDMVGDHELELYFEGNSSPDLRSDIWETGMALGFPGFIPEVRHFILDDHTPFLQKGIPAVDIIDFDYPYWHTSQDDLERVSAESLEQVGRTLEAWLESLPPDAP